MIDKCLQALDERAESFLISSTTASTSPHTPAMFSKLQRMKPAGYTLAATIISIGGILNGFDTGSIGAITSMKQFADSFGVLTPTMRGFTVSLIMLTGAVPSVFAGQLADKWGRLSISGIGAFTFLFGVLLQIASENLKLFLVGRAIAGLGQGLWLPNVIVCVRIDIVRGAQS